MANNSSTQKHPFHLVDPSPWPLTTSLALFLVTFGAVHFFHDGSPLTMIIGLLMLLTSAALWWRDVIKESNTKGIYTDHVRTGLRVGMVLFICSEIMFFVAFFWAFFDVSLFPAETHQYLRATYTGGTWPPVGVETIPAFDLPFMMTMILLLSGCTVTWAHHAILEGKNKDVILGLGLSAGLGAIFLCFQMYEYAHATFAFKQGAFASTFYMATGFHGFHVFVGTVFLVVCWLRAKKGHFTQTKHFGFEAAAWYWHFVDVVWLFLFIAIYWWGGTAAFHQ